MSCSSCAPHAGVRPFPAAAAPRRRPADRHIAGGVLRINFDRRALPSFERHACELASLTIWA